MDKGTGIWPAETGTDPGPTLRVTSSKRKTLKIEECKVQWRLHFVVRESEAMGPHAMPPWVTRAGPAPRIRPLRQTAVLIVSESRCISRLQSRFECEMKYRSGREDSNYMYTHSSEVPPTQTPPTHPPTQSNPPNHPSVHSSLKPPPVSSATHPGVHSLP